MADQGGEGNWGKQSHEAPLCGDLGNEALIQINGRLFVSHRAPIRRAGRPEERPSQLPAFPPNICQETGFAHARA